MIRLACQLATALLLGAVLVLVALWYFQDKLIFVPNIDNAADISPHANPPGWRRPTDLNIPYEDVYVETEPGYKLHGWLMKQPDSRSRPTIVFFHGNAGNIGHRLPNYAHMYKHLKVNIFASSYRGYGLSPGLPSERAFFADSLKTIDFLANHESLDSTKLIVFGRSIGGAVAVELARQRPICRALILENAFWSLKEMAVAIFTPLAYVRSILDLLIRHKFDNGKAIAELRQPILFISGELDEIVPPIHMKRLFDAASKSVFRMWVSVAQGTHNETWLIHGQAYYAAIAEFLDTVCSTRDFGEATVKRVQVGVPTVRVSSSSSADDKTSSTWLKLRADMSNVFGGKKEL